MAQTNIDDIFKGYLTDISLTMTSEQSTYVKQTKAIEEQFLKFGLSNEQLAQIVSEINGKAMQYITQYANSSALELVKLNENRPLLAAQIALAEKELEIKEKDLLLKGKELELKDKEIALMSKELDIKDAELLIKQEQVMIAKEELKLKQQELLLKKEQMKEVAAKINLMEAQTLTEGKKLLSMQADITLKAAQSRNAVAEFDVIVEKAKTQHQETLVKAAQASEILAKKALIDAQKVTEGRQQDLLASQSRLVIRQVAGYDDNRRVKKAEMSSNMAGFAVNAGADNAGTMVNNANGHINSI